MKTRIITSVVAIAVFVPFCIFSKEPWFLFVIFCEIVALLGTYEMLKCIGLHKSVFISVISYPAVFACVLMTRLVATCGEYFLGVSFIYFTLIFLSVSASTFSKGRISVKDAAVGAVMTIYISFSASCILLLRDMELFGAPEQINVGAYLYLLVFVFAWLPDIGGYFVGMAFGKHKLIPNVSPKKTVEGFFGGIIFSLVASVVYSIVIGFKSDDIAGFFVFALLSIVCAVVSVFGDLIFSLIKRQYGIKDYGFIFPGHGGILDRFDSVLAVAPFFYMLSYCLNHAGLFADFAG